MTPGTDGRPDHMLALLGYLMDSFRRQVNERVRTMTLDGAPPAARSLRGSQIRLLSLTPADGLRVTDLADRVGMTKQSLGEFATALERQGLMESVRDPADRRVRILRPTPDGLAALVAGERVIAEVEAEFRERAGAETWDTLREILTRLTAPDPSEGHPASTWTPSSSR